jgi:hypothetical protein
VVRHPTLIACSHRSARLPAGNNSRTAPPILYLNAGICRTDLLVEIEAVGAGVQRGAL